MTRNGKKSLNIYPQEHWIRNSDIEQRLKIYLDIQRKSYSKVKNQFICSLIGNPSGKKMLDFGCGCGFFTNFAKSNNASLVVGIDREINAIKTARYYGKETGGNSEHFILGDNLPFTGEKVFDIVLLKDVIEHIENDNLMVQRISRLLTENGFLILSTQNSFSLNYLIQGLYYRVFRNEKNWYGWDPTHLRFYTPGKLKAILRGNGMEIVEWRSNYIIPHKIARVFEKDKYIRLNFLTVLDRLFGKVFPFNRIGWNIIIKARKKQSHNG